MALRSILCSLPKQMASGDAVKLSICAATRLPVMPGGKRTPRDGRRRASLELKMNWPALHELGENVKDRAAGVEM